jgi:hypothetical protein
MMIIRQVVKFQLLDLRRGAWVDIEVAFKTPPETAGAYVPDTIVVSEAGANRMEYKVEDAT